jgi:hypothetical protein
VKIANFQFSKPPPPLTQIAIPTILTNKQQKQPEQKNDKETKRQNQAEETYLERKPKPEKTATKTSAKN